VKYFNGFHLIDAKFNESVAPEYYQQVPSPNPTMQQAQPLPIINQTIAVPGDYPMACSCPYCHQSIVTRIEKENGLLVWLVVGGLCVFGCFLGCCLIPFCINEFKV